MYDVVQKLKKSLTEDQLFEIQGALTTGQYEALVKLLKASEDEVKEAAGDLNDQIMDDPLKAMEIYDLLTEEQTKLVDALNDEEED